MTTPAVAPIEKRPPWIEEFLNTTRAFEVALKSAHVATLKYVQKQLDEKFKQLTEETDKIRNLKDLVSLCDKSTNKEGVLDLTSLSDEQKERATKTLADYEIKEADILKKTLNNFERELLIDSIKMKIENIELPKNRITLQIQECLYTRNEAYVNAKSNNKSLDDAKRKMSSHISGR